MMVHTGQKSRVSDSSLSRPLRLQQQFPLPHKQQIVSAALPLFPASIASVPTTGEGPSPAWCRVDGTRMRGNTAPVVIFAASCQRAQRPDRAELGGAVRDGHGHAAAGAVPFGAGQGQAQAALVRLRVLHPDRRQFGAAQRAGEADQQQGGRAARPVRRGCEARIRGISAVAASYLASSSQASAAARARVAATRASAVGTGRPATRCR